MIKQAKAVLGWMVMGKLLVGMVSGGENAVSVIPAPSQVEAHSGVFKLKKSTAIWFDSGCEGEAKLLADRLHSKSVEVLPGNNSESGADQHAISLLLHGASSDLGPEGYVLKVSPERIQILANSSAGVFYGVQTLLQLLPAEVFSKEPKSHKTWKIACVDIRDQPRFGWRGLMLDCSRHFFTLPEVEQVIDAMAIYKLNKFHWHLVDDQGWRIEIKKYPRLTEVGAWRDGTGFGLDPKDSTTYDAAGRYGGFYTQQDIREVVAYAAARHIEVVPEIEMPGHSSAALAAYPEYGCTGKPIEVPLKGGVFIGVYCAGNDATFTFLADVLKEVTGLFPSKYVHIGGDEVDKRPWQACPKCQHRIEEEHLQGQSGLQSYFVHRAELILNGYGKTLIGWSEIREGGLAPSAVLMDWIGGGSEAAASGHDVVMTPTKYCYFDHYQSTNHTTEPKAIGGFLPLEQVYAFDPVPTGLTPEQQARILGGQANLWTEYVPNLRRAEYMLFPRLCAMAEDDWSTKDAHNWEEFQHRVELNQSRLDALGVNYRPLAGPVVDPKP